MIPVFLHRLFWMFLASVLMSATPMTRAADLLGPEDAFRISAQLVNPALIEVRYRIADGYYLYREKFSFGVQPASVRLEKPQMPRGVVHQDEFFGKVETYRGEVVVRLPLSAPLEAGAALKAMSQGCADAGICYPPQTHNVEILPTGLGATEGPAVPARKRSGILARLSEPAAAAQGLPLGTQGNGEFLPVDEAFKVQARMPDAQTVVVRFAPAEDYYLYRDKITFVVDAAAPGGIDSVNLPRGEMKKDPNFGDTEVFHRAFQAVLRLKNPAEGAFALTVGYQGCSEKGLCYPPEKKVYSLAFSGTPADSPATMEAAPAVPAMATTAMADDGRIASLLGGGNFLLIIASFLGFGLLLSLTPCMWPMIPILSGIIAGQGERLTRSRGLALSATYVLGMALAYAIAGVAAGLTGTLLSSALQNPWVLGGFALVFVVLSLSMFGFYELQLPTALQSKLSSTSNRLKGGTLTGVFLMGVLSAVIVGPCVAAPLAGALLYISQSRDMVLGGAALFAMALGMGLPLLVIGASAGAFLPKAGAWMQAVKNVFGVLLLAAAIWIVSPVVPDVVHMLLWAALLIVSAIYLRAIDALPPNAGGFQKLWKGIGVIALALGIALLVGAASGGRDILRPLSGLRATGSDALSHTPFVRIGSLAELDAAVAGAGRPVMLDFYADWCVSCKEMERFTFSDEGVRKRLGGMLLLQADVTANNANDKALLSHFDLFGPPGIIFFDRHGRELKDTRVIGFQTADRFVAVLDAVGGR